LPFPGPRFCLRFPTARSATPPRSSPGSSADSELAIWRRVRAWNADLWNASNQCSVLAIACSSPLRHWETIDRARAAVAVQRHGQREPDAELRYP
jgi:hypothetical protein